MADILPLAKVEEAYSRDKPRAKQGVYRSCKLLMTEAKVVYSL